MSDRYALIRNSLVENTILWDGDLKKWQPPEGFLCIPNPEHVGIGWTWDGQAFNAPVVETPPVEPVTSETPAELPPTE
jgi:hypothetical protein